MKLTSSSTARLRTARGASGSRGSPQMPGPGRRIEPNPIRLTVRSPSVIVPAALAVILLIMSLNPLACCAATDGARSGLAQLQSSAWHTPQPLSPQGRDLSLPPAKPASGGQAMATRIVRVWKRYGTDAGVDRYCRDDFPASVLPHLRSI